jgi:hypothetical protein
MLKSLIARILNHRPKLGSRGQGTVEYILLLIISVALVLALSALYVKPMNNWIKFYLGDYYRCLLQTGELPLLGGQSENESVCKVYLSSAQQAIASGASGSGGSGGNGPGGKGANGKGANGKNGSGGPGGDGSDGSDGSDGGGNDGGGGSDSIGTAGGRGRGASRRMSNASSRRTDEAPTTGVGEGGDSKRRSAGKGGDSGKNFFKGGNNAQQVIYISRGGVKQTYSVERLSVRDKKKAKSEQNRSRVIASSGSVGDAERKVMVIKEKPKVEVVEEKKNSFSFGNIMRIAMMIIIIGALVLFIGGQALQISKSWEK